MEKEINQLGNNLIRPIHLSGEDAISFANSIFRPSRETLIRNSKILENIENRIKIRRISDGYEADIEGLDLSFLDNN